MQLTQIDINKFLSISTVAQLAAALEVKEVYLLFVINHSQEAYTIFNIPKKKGGYRIVEAPDVILKQVQKKLNAYLQRVYTHIRPESVHGFIANFNTPIPPRNVVSNALPHEGARYILNTDIQHFFHAIDVWKVKTVFMSYPFYYNNDLASYLSILTTYQGRLPMGAPTSPVLSNFAFFMLDRSLQRYALHKGLTYTRYADDLTFSGEEARKADTLVEVIDLLATERFTINKEKTRVQSSKGRQVVTGLIVNEKVNVSRTYIRNIRAMLHNWQQSGLAYASQRNGSPERFIRLMRGKLDFLKMVRGAGDPVYRNLNYRFEALLQKQILHA
jgi:RNA-directed DNA polymerase